MKNSHKMSQKINLIFFIILISSCEFGYPGPCFLAMYSHTSQEALSENFESTPEAYKEKFELYLDNILALMRKPVTNYNYNWIQELSFYTEGQ